MIHFRIKIRTVPASQACTGSMGTLGRPYYHAGKSLFYYNNMVYAREACLIAWRQMPVCLPSGACL